MNHKFPDRTSKVECQKSPKLTYLFIGHLVLDDIRILGSLQLQVLVQVDLDLQLLIPRVHAATLAAHAALDLRAPVRLLLHGVTLGRAEVAVRSAAHAHAATAHAADLHAAARPARVASVAALAGHLRVL